MATITTYPVVSIPKVSMNVNADDQTESLRHFIGYPVEVVLRWESPEYGRRVQGTVLGVAPIAASSAVGGKSVLIVQRGPHLTALTLGSIDTVQRVL